MELFKNNEELKTNENLRVVHAANEQAYGQNAPYLKWTDKFLEEWENELVYYSGLIEDKNVPAISKDFAHEIAESRIRYHEKGIIKLEKQLIEPPCKNVSKLIEAHYKKEIFTGIDNANDAAVVISAYIRHALSDYDERLAEASDMRKDLKSNFNFKDYARAVMKQYEDAKYTKVVHMPDNSYRLVRKLGAYENIPISGKLPDFGELIMNSGRVDGIVQEYIEDPEEAIGLCRGIALREAKSITEALDGYLRQKTVDGLRRKEDYLNLDVPLNSKEYDCVNASVREIYQDVLLQIVEEKVIEIQGSLQRPIELEENDNAVSFIEEPEI